ncbi:50S ribosomal protein L18 [Legionella dresdenensis]|uniref:Large ribosomal subunit protein uL18 n=1 Tax=Legionella dresdenensis TaxID=450200 RepID=A0ABV8CEL4_9GAMM
MNKHLARKRRGLKTKAVQRSAKARLVVTKSSQHTSVQLITFGEKGDVVLAACSTLESALRGAKGTKVEKAQQVGKLIAERAKAANVSEVAFDRSGHAYHGRVKALAEGAREAGLIF